VIVDIGPLLSAGRPMSLDESLEIPAFGEFRFPSPARAVLALRRVDRGVQIDGSVTVGVAGECVRCLEDVTVPMTIDVDERFDPPGTTNDPLGENNVLSGTDLDVSDLVRQLVTSALPFGLVCGDDCRGLCTTCGRSKNPGGECDCPAMEGDHGEPQVEDPALEDA
jgi:uncharacterized protein